MQAVLIAMTILGCDDSVTQCSYVATVDKRWETVATCDAEAERQLKIYVNEKYPTVIAVCEQPKPVAAPEPPKIVDAAPPASAVQPEPQQAGGIGGFVDRVAEEVRARLPSGKRVKTVLAKPVHFVTDGYSWAVARLSD